MTKLNKDQIEQFGQDLQRPQVLKAVSDLRDNRVLAGILPIMKSFDGQYVEKTVNEIVKNTGIESDIAQQIIQDNDALKALSSLSTTKTTNIEFRSRDLQQEEVSAAQKLINALTRLFS